MDILGKSLDDLIKQDKKTAKGGGIHNKMRMMKGPGKQKKPNKFGQKADKKAKVVSKIKAPNRIRKTGRTLVINPNAGRR